MSMPDYTGRASGTQPGRNTTCVMVKHLMRFSRGYSRRTAQLHTRPGSLVVEEEGRFTACRRMPPFVDRVGRTDQVHDQVLDANTLVFQAAQVEGIVGSQHPQSAFAARDESLVGTISQQALNLARSSGLPRETTSSGRPNTYSEVGEVGRT